jgi:copper chaperone CopZ
MKTITLSINGMSCGHCVAGVRKALEAVPGATVRDVRIGSAEVALEQATQSHALVSAVRDAGYDAVKTPSRPAGTPDADERLLREPRIDVSPVAMNGCERIQ